MPGGVQFGAFPAYVAAPEDRPKVEALAAPTEILRLNCSIRPGVCMHVPYPTHDVDKLSIAEVGG